MWSVVVEVTEISVVSFICFTSYPPLKKHWQNANKRSQTFFVNLAGNIFTRISVYVLHAIQSSRSLLIISLAASTKDTISILSGLIATELCAKDAHETVNSTDGAVGAAAGMLSPRWKVGTIRLDAVIPPHPPPALSQKMSPTCLGEPTGLTSQVCETLIITICDQFFGISGDHFVAACRSSRSLTHSHIVDVSANIQIL